jgi:hypothetical protein
MTSSAVISLRPLRDALTSTTPLAALRDATIKRLVFDGLSRETVLGDLDDLREELGRSGLFDDEETVLVVMDMMVGWCSPHLSLVHVGNSEYDE